MVESIQANDITLAQLSERFALERSDDENFFREWQDELPELNPQEKQALDEVKNEYLYLSKYPLLEPIVKMVVLSPLLKLAGFYKPPFYIAAEKEIEITSDNEGTIIRGKLDILVFHPPFWVLVIEAKKAEFSLEVAIPQALVYMLANPNIEKPTFGFVTNGNEFQFIKLTRQGEPRYARSYPLSIYRGDDIYHAVAGLKHLAQLAIQP